MWERKNNVEIFAGILAATLENMAFIFTEELLEEDVLAEPGKCLVVEMRFRGPHRGRVNLAVQYPLSEELARNMLGIDEEEELKEAMAHDALKEILNMACGQFLTTRFGSKPVFDLTIPEVKEMEAKSWLELSRSSGTRLLKAENWQLAASIRMEDRS